MSLEVLRKIGLSDGEIKVYQAVLDIGNAPLNKIHERTGIERRNIYDILNKLIEKGLVAYIDENKKRTFQITSPNKLVSYVEDKKKELDNSKKLIEDELPNILSKFNSKKSEIQAEVFRGIEGIKAVFEDSLNYPETYWIGGGRYLPKKYPDWFFSWTARRAKKKVKWIYLMRHELRPEYKPFPYETVKFLPAEFSGTPTVTAVYGDKVVQLMLGEELFAFVIESKDLAENYKKYHKYLWDKVAKE
ncbi:MAG: helix-turn-helix domain-containing protein [archaeon]